MRRILNRHKEEPDSLELLRSERPDGVRLIAGKLPEDFRDRLAGAVNGRFAGCVLGAPVEGSSPEKMEKWANRIGDAFPPVDYWSRVKRESDICYAVSVRKDFSRGKMCCCPADDDIGYTLLGLLILEEYGPNFTTRDVGEAWKKYLSHDCAFTAERITYDNLMRGVAPEKAGRLRNYCAQLIGADIRCDAYGYAAAGMPEKAAELAYRDAVLSHTRNGIYGSMFFAASLAAAFTLRDPVEALRIGLQEIPKNCMLAKELRRAFEIAPSIHNFREAAAYVNKRFLGMRKNHTVNNAVLTLFGLSIGAGDFTKTISETVAMGYDNDCTAATAGSVAGACVGLENIDGHWYRPFNDKLRSYLKGHNDFRISDVVERFYRQALRVR